MLDNRGRIHKKVLFFTQEDAGYGLGKEPSGYIKIETRDKKGKISGLVQNLNDKSNKIRYKLYLIKSAEKMIVPVLICPIRLDRNGTQVEWEFNPDNVGGSGLPIEDFKIAAVLAEYTDKDNTDVLCPLAAYAEKKTKWRDKVKDIIYPKIKREYQEANQLAYAEDHNTFESKKSSTATDNIEDSQYQPEDYEETAEIREENDLGDEAREYNSFTEEEMYFREHLENAEEVAEGAGRGLHDDNDRYATITAEQNDDMNDMPEYDGIYENDLAHEDEVDNYKSGESFRSPCSSNTNTSYDMCRKCNLDCMAKGIDSTQKSAGDINKFRGSLERHFEVCNPFGSKRKDYKWWKVNNPVYLNNILYQSNIKSPILFNPAVMMAHFKYRYLIIGIYSDRMRKREYIVCGVPGVHNVDENPFGVMCNWVQVEGSRPKSGAFGYWLVYMDPKTGKLLKVN